MDYARKQTVSRENLSEQDMSPEGHSSPSIGLKASAFMREKEEIERENREAMQKYKEAEEKFKMAQRESMELRKY